MKGIRRGNPLWVPENLCKEPKSHSKTPNGHQKTQESHQQRTSSHWKMTNDRKTTVGAYCHTPDPHEPDFHISKNTANSNKTNRKKIINIRRFSK